MAQQPRTRSDLGRTRGPYPIFVGQSAKTTERAQTPRLARVARDSAFRNTLGQGAYVLDESGRLLDLNPAAEALLGWTTGELQGRNMHESVHYMRADGSPFREADCPLLGVLRSGVEFAETNDTLVRKDGSLLRVAYVSSPVIVDDAIVGAVLAFWER